MRIAFDLDAALRNRYSGFYTFASGLLKGINRLEERPDMVLFFQKRYEELAHGITGGLGTWAIPKPCPFKFRLLQNLWRFMPFPSMDSLIGGFDVYHCFHHFMPPQLAGPGLLTVHDLRRYCLPELYTKSRLKPFETAVKRADHFISVSEATKQDLCRVFDISPERVDVVHLACTHEKSWLNMEQKKQLKKELLGGHKPVFSDYLVAISSKDPRKNIKRIVRAFEAARSTLPKGTGLVILGCPPSPFRISSEAIFTPGLVDDIIPWLVCSRGLIFTSLYEGFGLPVLEGFRAGVPVVTSSCSSMPEVAGEAAFLVDPYDVRQIRDAMNTIMLDKAAAKFLTEAGCRRLKAFSWEKTARETIQIYQTLINNVNYQNND